MTTEEAAKSVGEEGIGKVRKTCKTCDKRVYVEPTRLTCPLCKTPFRVREKVVKAEKKAKKEAVKVQEKAEKKVKEPRKVKEVDADLLKKVSALYPSELKSSSAIAKKLGVKRKSVQRCIRAIKKGD